jgi:hypothetical protein
MQRAPLSRFDFRRMPYDVIQWEINSFLEPTERAAINTVLDWQERVYKPFPKNFARKFAVKVAMKTQRAHLCRINYMVTNEDVMGAGDARMAIQWIGLYADFLVKPAALPLFKYSRTGETKAKALSDLETMIHEDFVFSAFMTDEVREKIRHAMRVVEATVREVK